MKNEIQEWLSRMPKSGEEKVTRIGDIVFKIATEYRDDEFADETDVEAHCFAYSEVPNICEFWAKFGNISIEKVIEESGWEEEIILNDYSQDNPPKIQQLKSQPARALLELLMQTIK